MKEPYIKYENLIGFPTNTKEEIQLLKSTNEPSGFKVEDIYNYIQDLDIEKKVFDDSSRIELNKNACKIEKVVIHLQDKSEIEYTITKSLLNCYLNNNNKCIILNNYTIENNVFKYTVESGYSSYDLILIIG